MKLGTVSVEGAQRVAVAVDTPGERAVLLYAGLTMADLIEGTLSNPVETR